MPFPLALQKAEYPSPPPPVACEKGGFKTINYPKFMPIIAINKPNLRHSGKNEFATLA